MKGRRESSSGPTLHNSGPPRTKEAGSHGPGQGPRALDCAACRGRVGCMRLHACVCLGERVVGTGEDTVFWT